MFNNQSYTNIRQDYDFSLNPTQFEIEDVLIKNFSNIMADDHHNFSHRSIQHISLADTRFIDNDIHHSIYDRILDE